MSGPDRRPWDEDDAEFESHLNRNSDWAVTYGNLMSCLMIFFVMLSIASASRIEGMQTNQKAADQRFVEDTRAVEALFSRYDGQKIGRLEIARNQIRIVFLSSALFESGSAFLKSEAMPMLQQTFNILNEMPNAIQIEGHTDDSPLLPGSKFDSNAELSSARAFAILRYLEIRGIPEQRLSAIGYGDLRPQQSNATPEGRAANRRIEINILRREN